MRGRIDEGEVLDVTQLEGLHAQDDLREVRALDLRHGEAVALQEILMRVQADAHAILHTTRATGTLIGTALRYRLHRQALCARAGVVVADARQPGIDHITD